MDGDTQEDVEGREALRTILAHAKGSALDRLSEVPGGDPQKRLWALMLGEICKMAGMSMTEARELLSP